ncbi:VCBS repeat-containing protein, partial [bacterium]|nr:VCBS repeat-containing protein [bacterium]
MKKISKPLRSIYPSRLHLGLWTLFPFLAFLLLQTAAAQTTFSDEIIITGHTYGAESVFSADLDGDGDYDVLSASSGDEKIAWYENTDGLGSFGQQQIIINNASEAYSVFSADLDGDGDNDVLSASSYENKIAWYENRDGLGNFSLQQIITTNANEARSVFSADLDGDGDYDVLSASFDDNKIAWYRNEGPPPPEVTIDLTYVAGSPVPAGGGNLVFDVFVENAAPIPVEFDGWLEIAYEGGASTNLLLQPFNNYQPGWT